MKNPGRISCVSKKFIPGWVLDANLHLTMFYPNDVTIALIEWGLDPVRPEIMDPLCGELAPAHLALRPASGLGLALALLPQNGSELAHEELSVTPRVIEVPNLPVDQNDLVVVTRIAPSCLDVAQRCHRVGKISPRCVPPVIDDGENPQPAVELESGVELSLGTLGVD